MTTAAERIGQLVERFDRNIDAYRAGGYKEMEIRREFIDPFFAALGWDMDNRSGYAEAYKDVIHEDAIKVGGSTKAPDYCFRIGGTHSAKTLVQRQIDATDRQIDQLVYELYGLTEEEIAIVEGAAG